MQSETIPVVLFAYARPSHLSRTLVSLKDNAVPLIYAFSDGTRTPDKRKLVAQVRTLLHDVDWCDIRLVERDTNLGLGISIRTGVTEVLRRHKAVIVFEDDLICVPGTYQYLCAALRHYRDDRRVMSVTGWTHPKVTPDDISDQPYFDGRAESLVWGTWARAWTGMTDDSRTLMQRCNAKGIDVYRYGADLVEMAETELKKNIWAVRFLYLHILNQGLCLRPPHSMVEHIGFGSGTNCTSEELPWFANPPLRPCPGIPTVWPEPVEHERCSFLHQKMCGGRPTAPNAPPASLSRRIKCVLRKTAVRLTGSNTFETVTPSEFIKLFIPPLLIEMRRHFRADHVTEVKPIRDSIAFIGDYPCWADAQRDSVGYDSAVILQKTRDALLKVKHGEAVYERDSVLFDKPEYPLPLLAGLLREAARSNGRLSVLDFGGSLGSSYFQCRKFLESVPKLEWSVVEQKTYVDCGRQDFQSEQLHFYYTPEECLAYHKPNVLLLSSVLQYLPKAYEVLQQLLRLRIDSLIIDRTGFLESGRERLTVQHVPNSIYPASYPAWFLSEQRVHATVIAEDYALVADFKGNDTVSPVDEKAYFKGFIYEKALC